MQSNKIEETTGYRIEKLRKQHGLTQTELAKILGIHRNKLSYYETNERTPTVSDLIVLAKALNTTTDYLLCCSDLNSDDIKLQKINNFIGLKEEALFNLNKEKKIEDALKKNELDLCLTTDENELLDNIDEDYYRYDITNSFSLDLLNFLLSNENFESFKKIASLLFRYYDAFWEVISSHRIALFEQEQANNPENLNYRDELYVFAGIEEKFENSANLSKVCFYEAVEIFRELISDYSNKKSNDMELKRITKELEDIKENYIRRLEDANNN